MIAARQVAFGGGGKRGLSAKDYIQDGLVAMWDGIENAGWGVHDANATVWKDLVGGNDLENHGAIIRDDHVEFDGSGGCYADITNDNILFSTVSIEVVCKDESSSPSYLFYWVGSRSACSIAVGRYQNYWLRSSVRVAVPFSTELTSLCWSGASDVYRDGQKQTPSAYDYWTTPCYNFIGIGCGKSSSGITRFAKGKICAVRIHSRALAAEEIAHNYEIDKARFGL